MKKTKHLREKENKNKKKKQKKAKKRQNMKNPAEGNLPRRGCRASN